MLLKNIFTNLRTYSALIPLLTVLFIGLCPVFFDFRKLGKDELLLTTIDKTLLRSGLDWLGTPNVTKLTSLLEEKSDLLISMIDNGNFPIEFLSKCAKARFKVGRYAFKGHAYDLIVSGAINEDLRSDSRRIFQEITEFLLKIK